MRELIPWIVIALSIATMFTLAIVFDRRDARRVDLDKFYAEQGYSQIYSGTKNSVMVESERIAW